MMLEIGRKEIKVLMSGLLTLMILEMSTLPMSQAPMTAHTQVLVQNRYVHSFQAPCRAGTHQALCASA